MHKQEKVVELFLMVVKILLVDLVFLMSNVSITLVKCQDVLQQLVVQVYLKSVAQFIMDVQRSHVEFVMKEKSVVKKDFVSLTLPLKVLLRKKIVRLQQLQLV